MDKERIKVVNNIMERMNKIEDNQTKHAEELNRIERKRRKYNLRISNLKPYHNTDDVRTTVAKFIQQYGLLPGLDNMGLIRAELEQAFRFGKKDRSRPQQILVRFYSTEARNEIMAKSKRTDKSKELSPIYLQDDNSPQDYALKQEAKGYMAHAHKRGKEPRFFEGELKIAGEDGEKKS